MMNKFTKIVFAIMVACILALSCACSFGNKDSDSATDKTSDSVSESKSDTETDTEKGSESDGDSEQGKTDDYYLNIMSINLDQAAGGNSEKRAKTLAKIVDKLPDLFGVQEETPAWAAYLSSETADYGYAHVYEMRGGTTAPDEASGVFYSIDRFDLLDSGTFWLSETPDVSGSIGTAWGMQYCRVCTWVKLKDKQSDQTFAYFNTHFSYENETCRTEGAKVIAAEVKKIGVPAILSGDMNFASDEETATYAVFTEIFDDARIEATDTDSGNTFHNYGYAAGEAYSDGTCKNVPIDYIFCDKTYFNAEVYKIVREQGVKGDESTWASDHYCLFSKLKYSVKK